MIFFLQSALVIMAQLLSARNPEGPRVDNCLFDKFLGILLSDSVPAVGVKQIASLEGVAFLDTRSVEEYSVSRIPHAVRVGNQDIDSGLMDEYDLEQPLVVYCSIGLRSEAIVTQLRDLGYKNAYNLYGGIFEWANHKMPLHDLDGRPVSVIHAYKPWWGIWLHEGQKVYSLNLKSI